MEPVSASDAAKGENWLHEVKWDGIRGLSYIENGRLRIYTKHRNERTAFYPELLDITSLLHAKNAILDGEIVIFDKSGNPSFYYSLVRERIRDINKIRHYAGIYPAKYILFDIMYYNGKNLTREPLVERKKMLKSILNKSSIITLTDAFSNGEELYGLMRVKNWEGIVSKEKNSCYISGKTHNSWYKTKLSRKMLAVAGGIQWKSDMPNSLLLGIYKDNILHFIGKASLGLTQEHLYLLKENSLNLGIRECPFSRESIAGTKGYFTWITPVLTCWVHFMEFTNDGQLRHPKILGFSSAKPFEANGKEFVE